MLNTRGPAGSDSKKVDKALWDKSKPITNSLVGEAAVIINKNHNPSSGYRDRRVVRPDLSLAAAVLRLLGWWDIIITPSTIQAGGMLESSTDQSEVSQRSPLDEYKLAAERYRTAFCVKGELSPTESAQFTSVSKALAGYILRTQTNSYSAQHSVCNMELSETT